MYVIISTTKIRKILFISLEKSNNEPSSITLHVLFTTFFARSLMLQDNKLLLRSQLIHRMVIDIIRLDIFHQILTQNFSGKFHSFSL